LTDRLTTGRRGCACIPSPGCTLPPTRPSRRPVPTTSTPVLLSASTRNAGFYMSPSSCTTTTVSWVLAGDSPARSGGGVSGNCNRRGQDPGHIRAFRPPAAALYPGRSIGSQDDDRRARPLSGRTGPGRLCAEAKGGHRAVRRARLRGHWRGNARRIGSDARAAGGAILVARAAGAGDGIASGVRRALAARPAKARLGADFQDRTVHTSGCGQPLFRVRHERGCRQQRPRTLERYGFCRCAAFAWSYVWHAPCRGVYRPRRYHACTVGFRRAATRRKRKNRCGRTWNEHEGQGPHGHSRGGPEAGRLAELWRGRRAAFQHSVCDCAGSQWRSVVWHRGRRQSLRRRDLHHLQHPERAAPRLGGVDSRRQPGQAVAGLGILHRGPAGRRGGRVESSFRGFSQDL